MKLQKSLILILSVLVMTARSTAQTAEIIDDESLVPRYELPDPLISSEGRVIADREAWLRTRRPEILHSFQTQVYGGVPKFAHDAMVHSLARDEDALAVTAIRKQLTISFGKPPNNPSLDLLIYLPRHKTPVPIFLGLNFSGNHSVHPDPNIKLSTQWMGNGSPGIVNHQATEQARGSNASRWPISRILQRGYGLATIYCGDLDPDFDDGFQNGVHPLSYRPGQSSPQPDEWGTIGAWAWGLSRALDYFATDAEIDERRTIVMGHSRLEKTALWAAAQDERFAIAISNNSGCGGAALSRRRYGETIRRINTVFPHWFCQNFHRYNDREDELPIDQHMLIALIAPRPVLVCSAVEDRWADPRGEFLSVKGADAVYRLLGTAGLAAEEMPPANKLISSPLGYHIRPGKHGVWPSDWEVYLDFADKQLGETP